MLLSSMTDTSPPMNLTLDVDKPPNGHAFQPGDAVSGRVQLQLPDGLQVPDIQLVFQGSAKISLKPGFDAINQVADTHKQETATLFCIQKSLVPARAWKTEAALQTYTAVFSIPFPHYAQCCTRATASGAKPACNLPPSTRIACAGLAVTTAYTVTAVCRRPRARPSRFNLLAYIQRSLSASRVLPFVPPADDQLHVPELPPAARAAAAAVAAYVRPNAPLLGSQPASPPPSRQQQPLHAAPPPPPFRSSPLLSRTGSVRSSSTVSTSTSTSASASDTASLASSRPSLSEAPPLYAPPNATADCKLVRSSAFLSTAKFAIHLAMDGATPSSKRQYAPGGDAPGFLPAYTPSMTLEAVMPNLPIVTPGQPMPLGVFVRTPQPLLDACAAAGCTLVLRTMAVRLRCTTYARIGASMRVDDASWPLWSYKGSAPVDGAKLDAAALPWDKMGVVPARVSPGFRSCAVTRTYSLEVSMGVSTQAAPGTVAHATTSMRVMVSEPPPAYIMEE